MKLILIAQFRFHINCGLYIYHLNHLGSCLHVRGNQLHQFYADGSLLKHIRRLHPQVCIAKGILNSDYS